MDTLTVLLTSVPVVIEFFTHVSRAQTIFGIMTCPMYFGDVTLCSRHAMCGLHQVPQEMCLPGSFSCLLA